RGVSELLLAAEHRIKDARVLQVAGHPHVGDRDKAQSGVPQALFEPARDDLLNAFCDPGCSRIRHASSLSSARTFGRPTCAARSGNGAPSSSLEVNVTRELERDSHEPATLRCIRHRARAATTGRTAI